MRKRNRFVRIRLSERVSYANSLFCRYTAHDTMIWGQESAELKSHESEFAHRCRRTHQYLSDRRVLLAEATTEAQLACLRAEKKKQEEEDQKKPQLTAKQKRELEAKASRQRRLEAELENDYVYDDEEWAELEQKRRRENEAREASEAQQEQMNQAAADGGGGDSMSAEEEDSMKPPRVETSIDVCIVQYTNVCVSSSRMRNSSSYLLSTLCIIYGNGCSFYSSCLSISFPPELSLSLSLALSPCLSLSHTHTHMHAYI